MQGEQLLTMVQVTAILGIIAPPFTALLKRTRWSDQTKDMVVLLALVLVGGIAAFVVGDISPYACSVVDLLGCAGIIVGYVSLVVGHALVWYKMLWKPSGVYGRIAGK